VLLFTNLFVIIVALYHLKSASGSIFMDALSAKSPRLDSDRGKPQFNHLCPRNEELEAVARIVPVR